MTARKLKVYVYDPVPSGGRDWRALIAPYPLNWWDPRNDNSTAGDILVCHSAELVLPRAKSAASRGVAVAFVSGAPLSGRAEEGIYRRRMPVEKPLDPAFTVAFRRFATNFAQTGRARWELLEPLPVPENLLALYLFELADMADDLLAIPQGQALFEAALGEYRSVLKTLPDNGPSLMVADDPNALSRENLQRLLTVL